MEPTRARPVPFCFQSLRPAPLTSLLSLVLWVPLRSPRRYQRDASCNRCWFTLTPKTASRRSSCPTLLPFKLTTSTTGIISFPYSLGYLAFLTLRIKMYVPLGPGTEPLTSRRFSSLSTFTTFKFFAVTRALPMCPGKCWFFHTREG